MADTPLLVANFAQVNMARAISRQGPRTRGTMQEQALLVYKTSIRRQNQALLYTKD